jgi:hypothetical protein
MKNFIIANKSKKSRYIFEQISVFIKAQIENSLDLGWQAKDIILLANFDYEFMGVKSTNISLNKECLTGSKMFGMKYLFDNDLVDDIIWSHDLDAWQNVSFSCPEFKEVGIACYSNSKYNGGSIFWRPSAKDITYKIIEEINNNKENKEEPTLNRILKSKEYKNRVTNVNNTFNVGCSGYVKRWERSIKPIRVCHFHPYNRTAWETHGLDRNGLGVIGVSNRLENILRKYYPKLPTELSEHGKIAQKERKENRLKNNISS